MSCLTYDIRNRLCFRSKCQNITNLQFTKTTNIQTVVILFKFYATIFRTFFWKFLTFNKNCILFYKVVVCYF